VYPLGVLAVNNGTIDLTSATSGAFKMGLCTASAATWGSTQEAFQFVTDVTGAYTEVTSSGYGRVSLTSLTQARTTNKVVWTCASPISFGSSITLSAASAFIYTTLVGSADASFPVIAIIDFGGTVSSVSGLWEYTVDGTNGLAAWTES
jgi:hypothetical protein